MDFREENASEENQESIQAVLSHGTQDTVLRKLVDKSSCFLFPKLLVSIKDEGSLLEDNEESHLNDQERAAAEEEFEKEIAAEQLQSLPAPPATSMATSTPIDASISKNDLNESTVDITQPALLNQSQLSSDTATQSAAGEIVAPSQATSFRATQPTNPILAGASLSTYAHR